MIGLIAVLALLGSVLAVVFTAGTLFRITQLEQRCEALAKRLTDTDDTITRLNYNVIELRKQNTRLVTEYRKSVDVMEKLAEANRLIMGNKSNGRG